MSIATLFRKQATPDIAGEVDGHALDQFFRKARTHNGWRPIEVPDTLLKEAVELAKMGPTSANASPLRIVYVRSQEAKLRLKPALMPGNVDKTMAAPVNVIVAYPWIWIPRHGRPAVASHQNERCSASVYSNSYKGLPSKRQQSLRCEIDRRARWARFISARLGAR